MTVSTNSIQDEQMAVQQIRDGRDRIFSELGKVIVGQKEVINELLITLFAGGHCLITGAPGLAKTLLVRCIAEIFHLKFQRIQFTPDLMPADITGTEILEDTPDGRKMQFVRGPVFANVILADEINRTPPKTQAALLEAMQEHQVTAAGTRYSLPEPFFVLATQNPIEMEGTYPLPEAQLDRFMFNVHIDYLPTEDEVRVVQQTTSEQNGKNRNAVFCRRCSVVSQNGPQSAGCRRAGSVRGEAGRCQPPRPARHAGFREQVGQLGSRFAGRPISCARSQGPGSARRPLTCKPEDILRLVYPTLRHRILPGYRAEADGVGVEQIIDQLLDHVKPKP